MFIFIRNQVVNAFDRILEIILCAWLCFRDGSMYRTSNESPLNRDSTKEKQMRIFAIFETSGPVRIVKPARQRLVTQCFCQLKKSSRFCCVIALVKRFDFFLLKEESPEIYWILFSRESNPPRYPWHPEYQAKMVLQIILFSQQLR